MRKLLIISFLFISGCAGSGLEKKVTMMPDEVWIQYENSPTGAARDYKTSKVIGGLKWKFQ